MSDEQKQLLRDFDVMSPDELAYMRDMAAFLAPKGREKRSTLLKPIFSGRELTHPQVVFSSD